MTDVYEGSLIRMFRRLEELIRQLAQASKVMGSEDLERKFEESLTKVKRGMSSHVPIKYQSRLMLILCKQISLLRNLYICSSFCFILFWRLYKRYDIFLFFWFEFTRYDMLLHLHCSCSHHVSCIRTAPPYFKACIFDYGSRDV